MILCPHCGNPCKPVRRYRQRMYGGSPPWRPIPAEADADGYVVRTIHRCGFCPTPDVISAQGPRNKIRSRNDYLEPLGPHPLKVHDSPPPPHRNPLTPGQALGLLAFMGVLGERP